MLTHVQRPRHGRRSRGGVPTRPETSTGTDLMVHAPDDTAGRPSRPDLECMYGPATIAEPSTTSSVHVETSELPASCGRRRGDVRCTAHGRRDAGSVPRGPRPRTRVIVVANQKGGVGQDHHRPSTWPRAGAARRAGPGRRPRPAGQRLHRAGHRAPRRGCPSIYDVLVDGEPLQRGRAARCEHRRTSAAPRPPSTSPAPRSSWCRWWPGRPGCSARSTPTSGEQADRPAAGLRPDRLPAVARPAHGQRAGRRRARC